jgi:hypothetical protein
MIAGSGRWRRFVVSTFFGLLALLGVLLHRDYGIPWDEQLDRLNGIINAKYVALRLAPELAKREENFAVIPDMSENQDADHGVFFQLPLVVLERVVRANDTRDIYFFRHLVVFFTFVGGVYVFYRLAAHRFASWRVGLLGAGALVLSPRFFAEAFYNYKDLVFLTFFTLGIYTLVLFLRRPTWARALVHAAATGAAIDVRTMAVLLPVFTLVFAALEALFRPIRRRQFASGLGLYVLVLPLIVILGWPYLWEHPAEHFVAAFRSFSRYHPSDLLSVYLGQEVLARSLPWHYVPVWLLVTTPLPYSVLALIGILVLLRDAVRQGGQWLQTAANRQDLLFAAWFGGPVLAVIWFQSVIYDGWRHLYFIYPAFLLLALRGFTAVWPGGWRLKPGDKWLIMRLLRIGLGMLLVVGVAHTVFRMVRDHPYQNVYFSFLPGPVAERLFERDYWGLSGWEGMRWILAHDPSPQVTVGTDPRATVMLHNSRLLLPPAERARVVMSSAAQARYFLTVYRWHPHPYPASYGREVYQIRVNGNKILSVFERP